MYIERVIDEIKRLGISGPQGLIPCTEEEVALLEQQTHLSLPRAYREFLLTMGKGAGTLLRGSDWVYSDLPTLREVAPEILEEDHYSHPLPEDAFVFFMHQGYQFRFFRTSEGDDPPVYRYVEERDRNRETFLCIAEHFTEYLLNAVRDHAEAVRQIREDAKALREMRKHQQEQQGK